MVFGLLGKWLRLGEGWVKMSRIKLVWWFDFPIGFTKVFLSSPPQKKKDTHQMITTTLPTSPNMEAEKIVPLKKEHHLPKSSLFEVPFEYSIHTIKKWRTGLRLWLKVLPWLFPCNMGQLHPCKPLVLALQLRSCHCNHACLEGLKTWSFQDTSAAAILGTYAPQESVQAVVWWCNTWQNTVPTLDETSPNRAIIVSHHHQTKHRCWCHTLAFLLLLLDDLLKLRLKLICLL